MPMLDVKDKELYVQMADGTATLTHAIYCLAEFGIRTARRALQIRAKGSKLYVQTVDGTATLIHVVCCLTGLGIRIAHKNDAWFCSRNKIMR